MTRTRKTVEVSTLVDMVNRRLTGIPDTPEARTARSALASFVTDVLCDVNAYKGFRFTDGDNGRTDDSLRFFYGGNR